MIEFHPHKPNRSYKILSIYHL